MDVTKYKNLLFQKIKSQISQWVHSKDKQFISNEEITRFLHSLSQSAEGLGLGGLHQLSRSLLEKVKDQKDKQWPKDELNKFLLDLINLTNEYESFEEMNNRAEYSRNEKIPLIQIIDDDISMVILLKDVLEEKGWLVVANTIPEKAVSQYFDVNPDCVIIDADLPDNGGIEILEDLQKHMSKLFVPKIMISGLNDRHTRINSFRLGADDYLVKPIDLEELTVRIESHLQRKQIYDQSILLDELTSLYNRRFLKDVFNQNINELKRTGQIFSVSMLDIDHFKKINDQYGHLIGDKVLASFASFLKESTRQTDSIFRYGGEEFVILFPHTDLAQSSEIVTRLLKDFSEKQFEAANGDLFSVTFSAGVYFVSNSGETLETALNFADQALYKAKEAGRARVECLNQSLPEFVKRKLFISVIDDDRIIRTILTKILQSMVLANYEVDVQVFEDGITFFQSNRLDERGEHFLILDRVMPMMDGLEILQKVRQTKYDHNVLILMLTGRKNEDDIATALKYGADDYITKPFSITELQARIERLIHRMR